MNGRFITVTGEKSAGEMGYIQTHEHILTDFREVIKSLLGGKTDLIKEPITLENRGDVVYQCFSYEDNLYMNNKEVALEELKKFKEAGGNTLIDVTFKSIGRNPLTLRELSEKSGVNIIMGCGYYIISSWLDSDKKKTADQIEKEIIEEFSLGFGDTKIKPGVIGEVGIMDMNNPFEVKSLRASARAQKKIGCGLIIHPPIWAKEGHKILDILEEEGADFKRVILGHCDHDTSTIGDIDYFDSLVKRGVNLAYDGFGLEIMGAQGYFLPCDDKRIDMIKEHIKRGNIDKLLLSQDTWLKICFTKWGGWGYGHILNHIIPRMKKAGITEDQINAMTIENPQRILCF